jgi:hypothetical protein
MDTEETKTDSCRVLIAIPNGSGWCHEYVAFCRMGFVNKTKELLPNVKLEFALTAPHDIAEGRWDLAKQAVERNVDFLFFADSDMAIPEHALVELLSMMQSTEPVVGIATGLGFTNTVDDPRPSIYGRMEDGGYMPLYCYHSGGFRRYEIDACGMFCALIRTEIFQQIAEANNSIVEWYNMFKPNGASEDISFCKRAQDVGHQIFVDSEVKCGHFPRFPPLIDEALYFKQMEAGQYDELFGEEKPRGFDVR